MSRRVVLVVLVLLPLTTAGGPHFVRLLVLAAAGLAGLYMVHLLAQDWNNFNKITRRSRTATADRLLFKRHSAPPPLPVPQTRREKKELFLAATRAQLRRAEKMDPRGCAKRLVCQLAATPHHDRMPYQDDLLLMIWKNNEGRQQHDGFQSAADLGHRTKNQSACYDFFNNCPFPTAQLLNIMELPSAVHTSNTLTT